MCVRLITIDCIRIIYLVECRVDCFQACASFSLKNLPFALDVAAQRTDETLSKYMYVFIELGYREKTLSQHLMVSIILSEENDSQVYAVNCNRIN